MDGTLINTEKEFYMSFYEVLLNNYKIKIDEKIFKNSSVPILYNVNFGHSVPGCFLQYNALTNIDKKKEVSLLALELALVLCNK